MGASNSVRIALVRSLCRIYAASSTSNSSVTSRLSASSSASSIRSSFALRHPAASRYLRRELSSLLPLHSAVASACLISKLPDDAVSSEVQSIKERDVLQYKFQIYKLVDGFLVTSVVSNKFPLKQL